MAEYWSEATKRVMDDLDCTSKQKLKGAVFLLRDEAYQWWLTMREGTQVDRLTWDFFKAAFSGKYVGTSYVHARRKEFLNLTQGNKIVAEYKAQFLWLTRYAHEIVATKYEHCVQFEDGLRDELHVLIAPQREWDIAALVEKAKIAEEVKRFDCQICKKDRGTNKKDFRPLGSFGRPVKRARFDRPVQAVPSIVTRPQPCTDCGRAHQGECWK